MLRTTLAVPTLALVAAACAACGDARGGARAQRELDCDSPTVQRVVTELGQRMKDVSLLAPTSVVSRELRQAYARLVTEELLRDWVANPSGAPGRNVSSPWPARIDVDSARPVGPRTCEVRGLVVYVTGVEATRGGVAVSEPVMLRVRRDGEWRISAYEAPRRAVAVPAEPAGADSAAPVMDPRDVIRAYYGAIRAQDYRRAYELWGGGGFASGRTYEEFARGFAETATVDVDVGAPGRVEGAAGSRYVELPVTIRASTTSGERQRFEGTYTLRRSVVDGATAEQRRWHIYSAQIRRLPAGGSGSEAGRPPSNVPSDCEGR